jgi:hypothetical protein
VGELERVERGVWEGFMKFRLVEDPCWSYFVIPSTTKQEQSVLFEDRAARMMVRTTLDDVVVA